MSWFTFNDRKERGFTARRRLPTTTYIRDFVKNNRQVIRTYLKMRLDLPCCVAGPARVLVYCV
jgi:hypothetical protein